MSEQLAALAQQQIGGGEPQRKTKLAQHVFRVLHGMYGNLFLSKFATGQQNGDGTDVGIESAKTIWGHGLAKYDMAVIREALAACLQSHPEFPPSLPQMLSLCEARKPRATYAQQQGWQSLPPPVEAPTKPVDFTPQKDGKDWARRILARKEAGEKITAYTLASASMALGLQKTMSGGAA